MYDAKECSDCGRVFPLVYFVRDRTVRSGRGRCCLPCGRLRNNAAYHKRKITHPESHKRHLERSRESVLKANGWTLETKASAIAAQGGVCANWGCDRPAVHADHCHKTGRPRVVLCGQCNVALGLMGEDTLRILGLAALC